jgi:hypothetical protein
MAMFYGYFDESGKSHQHPVVVVSGFVSTYKNWDSVGDEWREMLRRHGMSSLHFAQDKRDAARVEDFIRVIKPRIEVGLTVAVHVEAFNAIPRALKKQLGGDPYHMAFRSVVLHLLSYLHQGDPQNTLNITCDEEQSTNVDCLKWYLSLKGSDARARKHLSGFGVADDKYYPQLQAADFLAGLFRAEAEFKVLGTDYHFRSIFEELILAGDANKLQMRLRILEKDDMEGLTREWAGAFS